MNVMYVSALAALVGSIFGGLTSGTSTWMNLRAQARATRRAHRISRQEDLFRDFICAASIAYLTAPEFRGRGFASRTAARLLAIAQEADPDIAVFAKTPPKETASTAILRRLGFKMIGEVLDEDIGKAWRWLLT